MWNCLPYLFEDKPHCQSVCVVSTIWWRSLIIVCCVSPNKSAFEPATTFFLWCFAPVFWLFPHLVVVVFCFSSLCLHSIYDPAGSVVVVRFIPRQQPISSATTTNLKYYLFECRTHTICCCIHTTRQPISIYKKNESEFSTIKKTKKKQRKEIFFFPFLYSFRRVGSYERRRRKKVKDIRGNGEGTRMQRIRPCLTSPAHQHRKAVYCCWPGSGNIFFSFFNSPLFFLYFFLLLDQQPLPFLYVHVLTYNKSFCCGCSRLQCDRVLLLYYYHNNNNNLFRLKLWYFFVCIRALFLYNDVSKYRDLVCIR